ncbi:hypothetical protein V8D89_013540 [Ganoderma adspersum]
MIPIAAPTSILTVALSSHGVVTFLAWNCLQVGRFGASGVSRLLTPRSGVGDGDGGWTFQDLPQHRSPRCFCWPQRLVVRVPERNTTELCAPRHHAS